VFEGHRLASSGSRWDTRWVSGGGKTWFFVYLAWRLWKSVLRLAVRGNSICGGVVRRQRVPVFEGHRLASSGSRWDIRWVSGGGNTWFFVYLAWRLWKSVLRLAVRGNSICGGVVRRQRVPVFEGHRLASSGSRWDIRWVSGGGKTWFCVYLAWRLWKSVLRLAVRGNSICGGVVRRQRVPVFEGHRLASSGSRWDTRWVSGGGKTWFFVYLAWRLWKSVLRLAVRGNSICGGVVRRQRVPVFEGHRLASSGSQWDIRWVSGGGKTWFCVYLAWRLWKSVLRLAVRGNSICGGVVRRQRVPVFEGHRLASSGSRWDTRWVSGGGKTWFFVYLAWRLWKSVLRLAVRGNSICGGVVRRQRVPVFEGHRLASSGSRWDIRWVSGGGKTWLCLY
jgi:hypothetical protein